MFTFLTIISQPFPSHGPLRIAMAAWWYFLVFSLVNRVEAARILFKPDVEARQQRADNEPSQASSTPEWQPSVEAHGHEWHLKVAPHRAWHDGASMTEVGGHARVLLSNTSPQASPVDGIDVKVQPYNVSLASKLKERLGQRKRTPCATGPGDMSGCGQSKKPTVKAGQIKIEQPSSPQTVLMELGRRVEKEASQSMTLARSASRSIIETLTEMTFAVWVSGIAVFIMFLCCCCYPTSSSSSTNEASDSDSESRMDENNKLEAVREDEHEACLKLSSLISGPIKKYPSSSVAGFFKRVKGAPFDERYMGIRLASHGKMWRASTLAWWKDEKNYKNGGPEMNSLFLKNISSIQVRETKGNVHPNGVILRHWQSDKMQSMFIYFPSDPARNQFVDNMEALVAQIRTFNRRGTLHGAAREAQKAIVDQRQRHLSPSGTANAPYSESSPGDESS